MRELQVTEFDAHSDYIRCVDIHPTEPLILSCGDDMSIKLWNWDQGWKNIRVPLRSASDPVDIRRPLPLRDAGQVQPQRQQHIRLVLSRQHNQGLGPERVLALLLPNRAQDGRELHRLQQRERQALSDFGL